MNWQSSSSGESPIILHPISRPKIRKSLFLRRNVRKVLRSLTSMGGTISSLKQSLSVAEQDDEETRPPKRRKLNKPPLPNTPLFKDDSCACDRNPPNHPTDHMSRPPLRPINLSNPRGNARPKSSPATAETPLLPLVLGKKSIQILPSTPVDFQRSLLIDLDSIYSPSARTESPAVGEQRQPVDIKCNCTAALFYAKDSDDFEQGQYAETCRHIKPCTLRVRYGVDTTSELKLPEPFVFNQHELYVNRRTIASGKIQYTYGLADDYHVQISIHPVGFQDAWPPVCIPTSAELKHNGLAIQLTAVSEALEEGRIASNYLSLSCVTGNLFNLTQQKLPVAINLCHGPLEQPLDYVLNLKIRWALPNPRATLPPSPCLTVGNTSTPRKPGTSLSFSSQSNSRTPRHRSNVPTYNLKALSAQAQGRSPKKYRRSDVTLQPSFADETVVTYSFGGADAAEAGIKQQTTVTGLNCPFCNSHSTAVDHLRLHLCNEHGTFKFSLRRCDPPRVSFFVEVVKFRSALPRERERTFQLGKPLALFDLERYLSGDNSWVKRRQGPQHNLLAEHIASVELDPSLSSPSSPRELPHSSPTTSPYADEVEAPRKGNRPAKPLIRPCKVVHAPETTKPLYHAITKQLLSTGEELPSSDDETSECWLNQKHRDGINDFTDLTPEEKEYIHQWNPFAMKEQLTSPKYLPNAMVRFVEANKTWLREKGSRRRELIMHCSVFIMRGVMTQQDFSTCVELLRQANHAEVIVDAGMNTDELGKMDRPPKLRGALDCACGGVTELANRVACRGNKTNECPGRFFHRSCAAKLGRQLMRKWLCDHCFALESTRI